MSTAQLTPVRAVAMTIVFFMAWTQSLVSVLIILGPYNVTGESGKFIASS